jgi:hypothetical protein
MNGSNHTWIYMKKGRFSRHIAITSVKCIHHKVGYELLCFLPECLTENLNHVLVPSRFDTVTNIVEENFKFIFLSSLMTLSCKITHVFTISWTDFLSQKWVKHQTIANWACDTPKSLSISFRYASWAWEKQFPSLLMDVEWFCQMLIRKDRCRQLDNTQLYSHGHWQCIC